MTGDAWARAVRSMSDQHGLALRSDLIEAGVPARTIQRRLAEGLLVRVNHRVLALPGLPIDLAALTRAAVMVHPQAIPTGPSAAALLGSGPWDAFDLGDRPWLVHERVAGVGARFVTHPGVRTVRACGIRVAHPGDAVVDLLRLWPWRDALDLGQRAVVRRTITPADLVAAHARMTRMSGRAQLGRIVAELSRGTRSEAERRLVDLLRAVGIKGWRADLRVVTPGRVYHLDIGFEAERLELAVDGRAFHTDARSFQIDRSRQNALVAEGWTILRFTWDDIVHRPREVVLQIQTMLARLRARAA